MNVEWFVAGARAILFNFDGILSTSSIYGYRNSNAAKLIRAVGSN